MVGSSELAYFTLCSLASPKIQNLDALVLRHKDAFRLEIAVNDAGDRVPRPVRAQL